MKNDRIEKIRGLANAYLADTQERKALLDELAALEQVVIVDAHAAFRDAVVAELAADFDPAESASLLGKVDAALAKDAEPKS